MKTDKQVFLIEDDEVDVLTFQRALKELSLPNKVTHFNNAEVALNYFKSTLVMEPSIIIIDISMPGISGLDFLKQRHGIAALRNVPVIMLTTSENRTDINMSYELGASGYLVKSIENKNYVSTVSAILNYWNACEIRQTV